MSVSVIFSKLKSLGPVAVVIGAVAITAKLLTTQATLNQDELKVTAEEDINTTSYEDEIVIPPPPKEELPEEEEEKAKGDEEEEDFLEEEQETESAEQSEQTNEEQKKEEEAQKKDEKEKSKPRKFIEGNKFSGILSKLLGAGKKK